MMKQNGGSTISKSLTSTNMAKKKDRTDYKHDAISLDPDAQEDAISHRLTIQSDKMKSEGYR